MKRQFSKRMVVILIAVVFCFTMCACGNKNPEDFEASASDFNIHFDGSDESAGEQSSDTDSGKDASDLRNGDEGKNSGKNGNSDQKTDSKSEKAGSGVNTATSDNTEEEFVPMSIPSRKSAYKLSNTYSKIKNGETVKVVYYGGSVTNGNGASDDEKTSYRALTTAYLKTLSSKVIETNLCIGGTGTYLAAARFEHDVISVNPDLLIIEFAINDVYSGITAEQSKANLEYMIKKLYAKNPNADILIALVTNKSNYGRQYNAYKAHVAVANHYGIPVVDLGGEMYNRLKGEYDGFQSNDSVHPNDTGHKIYANVMIDALKELFVDGSVSAHKMPANALCKNGFTSLTNTVAANISKDNTWSLYSWFTNTDYEKVGSALRSSAILKTLYPKYLAPDNTGCTLSFTFTGNSFGFIGTLKDGARCQFVIDGKDSKTVTGSTNTGLLEYPVFENLSNTSHTVTVTIQGQNPFVTIASFVTTK